MATILVVDDERVLCDLMKTVLENHGHEVLTACNGREALDLFSQHRPQFTLLDLRMPDMSGIEVLRKIRTIDARATVMILTARGSDDLEKQARQLGVTDFLSKTLTLDKIVGSMERFLPPATRMVEPPLQPTERTGSPAPPVAEPKCPNGHAGHMIPVQKQPHEVTSTPQPGWMCKVCGAIVMRCVCGRPLYRDPSTRTVEDCRNPDCVLAKKTLPKARKKKPSALRRPPRR